MQKKDLGESRLISGDPGVWYMWVDGRHWDSIDVILGFAELRDFPFMPLTEHNHHHKYLGSKVVWPFFGFVIFPCLPSNTAT